mmetsp:Transcript_25494/g.71317  ORF Transcript_25494/g.71317 Transcript_25494/m.71317 type:complete len:228 (-) Transcript_25494:720-1403(-)
MTPWLAARSSRKNWLDRLRPKSRKPRPSWSAARLNTTRPNKLPWRKSRFSEGRRWKLWQSASKRLPWSSERCCQRQLQLARASKPTKQSHEMVVSGSKTACMRSHVLFSMDKSRCFMRKARPSVKSTVDGKSFSHSTFRQKKMVAKVMQKRQTKMRQHLHHHRRRRMEKLSPMLRMTILVAMTQQMRFQMTPVLVTELTHPTQHQPQQPRNLRRRIKSERFANCFSV